MYILLPKSTLFIPYYFPPSLVSITLRLPPTWFFVWFRYIMPQKCHIKLFLKQVLWGLTSSYYIMPQFEQILQEVFRHLGDHG